MRKLDICARCSHFSNYVNLFGCNCDSDNGSGLDYFSPENYIESNLPDSCNYKLEHLVLESEKTVEQAVEEQRKIEKELWVDTDNWLMSQKDVLEQIEMKK